MNSIAIIPARGGSKRIPRKNIKEFHNKPIIGYSIEAAINSGIFDTVMVSTDDEEVASIAKMYGAEVPFYRSRETASEMASTASVLLEVLEEYEKLGKSFEYVCCLYPCAPFITPLMLKESMEKLIASGADSVVPIVKYSYPPQRSFVCRDGRIAMLWPEYYSGRTQDLEPLYHDAGQFYCVDSSSLKNEEKLFCQYSIPIVLLESEVHDIDTIDDWKMAEMKYRILKNSK